MTTRAERRAQRKTIRLRRLHRIPWAREAIERGDGRRPGAVIDTPVLCSCWMCGNRRQHDGRSIQERRQAAAP